MATPFRSSIDNRLEVHVDARILDLPIDECMDVLSTDDCIAFESRPLTEPKPFRHAASAPPWRLRRASEGETVTGHRSREWTIPA